jgi:magnesium transporter
VFQTDLPPEDLHSSLDDPGSLIWVDLESPSEDELGLIGGILRWDHLTIEDLTKQGQRGKLEHFDDYVLLVMHSLSYDGDPPTLNTPEFDFVIGANYIVTTHYVPLPHITEAREVVGHTEAILGQGRDYLLYMLSDRLVDSYFPVLDAMHEAVDDLEDQIVSNPSNELLSRIFAMKRDSVKLRKAMSPQVEVFSRLTAPGLGIVTEDQVVYFRDVHDHLLRAFETVETYRELMSGALDAYLSNVSNRMNEVMKRLTVVAALFLPITFVTGLLGMNLRETPAWQDSLFRIFLAAMAIFTAIQYVFFRRRGWAQLEGTESLETGDTDTKEDSVSNLVHPGSVSTRWICLTDF